jgi:hypothetical protein
MNVFSSQCGSMLILDLPTALHSNPARRADIRLITNTSFSTKPQNAVVP